MKHVALLVLGCAIVSGTLVQAQGKKGRPAAKSPSSGGNQAALYYQAAATQRQQAALAASLAQQARLQNRRQSTVVIRTTINSSNGKKGAQPLVLSTQTTARYQKHGNTTSLTVRSTSKGPGASGAYVPGMFNPYAPGMFGYRPGMVATNGPGKYKQTVTIGSGKNAVKSTFTEQVSVKGGRQVVLDKWTTTARNPALAALPLQLQMNQLESLMPHYRPWHPPSWHPHTRWSWDGNSWHHHTYWTHDRPWWDRPWYAQRPWWDRPSQLPYQPLALAAAQGKKTNIQTTMNWAGGSEKIKTSIVNQYDKAGRFIGAQVQVRDTKKGNASVLPALTPQAQLSLLEAAADPYNPYALNPIAYSWGRPHYYYPNWRALDRIAALEGYW